MSKVKNIKELRDEMLDALDLVKSDPRRMAQVSVMANCAGKALSTIKAELEEAKLGKFTPNIPFLKYAKD